MEIGQVEAILRYPGAGRLARGSIRMGASTKFVAADAAIGWLEAPVCAVPPESGIAVLDVVQRYTRRSALNVFKDGVAATGD